MPGVPAAPTLEFTLSRLLARERRRRRGAALWRTCAATALAALLVAAWRIYDRVIGVDPLPILDGVALVAVTAIVGLAFVVRAATCRSEREMAREMDRRLGLADRASSALTIVRGASASRLAAFVVDDAEHALAVAAPRIDAAFPPGPARRSYATPRFLAKAALVAAALAVLAELLDVWGPIPILPGFKNRGGGETSALVPAAKDAPRRDVEKPKDAASPSNAPTPAKPKPDDVEKPAKPEGGVHVAIKPSKDEYDADEPIPVSIVATATGEIRGARVFDVRVSVDGDDCDTGLQMTLDPAHPEGARATLDLRQVPGLKIEAGEHAARARLATRSTRDEHESAPAKFRVRAPKDDQKKKNDAPNENPKPKPKPQPKDDAPLKPGDPTPKKNEPPAAGPPPPPPAALDKKVVVPLFGEGDEVKKKGLVLVLDPSGGIETPPKERPLGDALPDAKKRAEAAVDRAGIRDEDRELVRRYFDLLEKLSR